MSWKHGMVGVCALAAVAGSMVITGERQADAFPSFLTAFNERYPGNTLAPRMATMTGSQCNACHHPPTRDEPGTCYRTAMQQLFNDIDGISIEDVLDLLDGVDSDNDGVPNGVEILTARTDMPGQIGFHPGLVGPTGTDPCGLNPNAAVTNVLETPPIVCISECDGVQGVDINDFFCFLNRFSANDPLADLDNSGTVDVNDFFVYLNFFSQGC